MNKTVRGISITAQPGAGSTSGNIKFLFSYIKRMRTILTAVLIITLIYTLYTTSALSLSWVSFSYNGKQVTGDISLIRQNNLCKEDNAAINEADPNSEEIQTGGPLELLMDLAGFSNNNYEEGKPDSGCHLPSLNPYDNSVMQFIIPPEPLNCTEKYPLIFSTDLNNTILQLSIPDDYGWTNCCYRNILRTPETDMYESLSIDCKEIKGKHTEISPEDEFIAISCDTMNEPFNTQVVDALSFVPPKPLKETVDESVDAQYLLNLLIIGLDGLSHMNFIRLMPTSYNFLVRNLSAYGMHGYTKVADNTYPNIVPVLTSFTEEELEEECLICEESLPYFDSCPFLWKNFSERGFSTSLAEDAPWIGIFNYEKVGFRDPPVDYYLRPMTHFQEKLLGNHKALNVDLCYGPRVTFEILLDYAKKMALRMKNIYRYFQFIWATALFHDSLTDGMHGDKYLFSTLKWLHQNNYLNNTALIVMSDHGVRFGAIRYTYQGKIEERMPLLYFALPDWFHRRYSTAIKNLMENSRRLTTPFDLHETLKDFLDPETTISDNSIRERSAILLSITDDLPRGISHFLPIPSHRNCEMAAIDEHWCVCHQLQSLDMKKNALLVKQLANTAVYFINKLLEPFHECAFLSLLSIISAQTIHTTSSILNETDIETNFGVTFITDPGNGTFEATVSVNYIGTWSLTKDVSRINLYRNQSHCVHDYKIKKYCYCLQQQA